MKLLTTLRNIRLATILRILWAIFLVTLPVTSFPYFPSGLGGKTLVRPLATYPLLLLLTFGVLPALFKRPLPRTLLPLLAFILAAVTSSVVALSADISALRGVTPLERLVRGMATLGLGAAFYLAVAVIPQTWEDMRFTLRCLYTGFAAALTWASFQALYILHFSPAYFKLLNQIQAFISTRKLFTTRISGMTYEPKWFAEQISFLLLPWLLGTLIARATHPGQKNISAWNIAIPDPRALIAAPGRVPQRPKILIDIEWLLLAWASGIIIFTFSRTGMFILGLLVVISFIWYRASRSRSQAKSEASINRPTHQRGKLYSGKLYSATLIVETLFVLGTLLAVFVIIGAQNPYFSRFWRYFTEAQKRNRTYLEYIAFEQRFTYWETAFRMFESYPWVGVGLGNYAFYFNEMLPDRLYRQVEIIRQTTPEEGRDRLITPKNLPARLLAETGLLGSITFITFIFAVLGCLLYLWCSPHLEQRAWAIRGILAFIAFLFVIFSVDSFAIPNMWVVFGLITAAAHLPDPEE